MNTIVNNQLAKKSPLDNFIGQGSVRERLKVFAHSGRRIPPILLTAPAGMGKNHVTEAFAEEAGAKLYHINAVNLENSLILNKFMKAPCSNNERSILLIDESGEMKRRIDTAFLTCLEEPYTMETRIKAGKRIEVYRFQIPEHVSFLFATTHMGRLSKALISRCIHLSFDDYEEDELSLIAKNHFDKNQFRVDAFALRSFAKISRSVRHLIQICDCAMIYGKHSIDSGVVSETLKQLQLTEEGFTKQDIKLLNYLAGRNHASERDCLAYLTMEKEEYGMIEAFLVKKECIEISSRGRSITKNGLDAIGCDITIFNNDVFGEKIEI